MISRTAEYALRAVVHLTAVQATDASQTVEQIAAGTKVPAGYLAKVLQSLRRAGIIASQRGAGGGFRLAKPARDISLYAVVQAVDPVQRIHTCPLGLAAHGTTLCPLHRRLDDAMAVIEAQFRATAITELLVAPEPKRRSSAALRPCVFPRSQAPRQGTVRRLKAPRAAAP